MTTVPTAECERVVKTDNEGNAFELREMTCPTCGPDASQRYVGIRGGPTHRYGKGVACDIVCCAVCGLYFANPFPFPVDAQRLYGDPAKYFVAHDVDKKIQFNRDLVRGFLGMLGRKDVALLDVGSGRGELLAAAKAEGVARIVGLELSSAMIEHAKQTFDVEVVQQLIEAYASHTTDKFDVIVLNAVLEHVYNPDAMIAACASLMAPHGLLYIDVPNEDHLLARIGHLVNRVRGRNDVYVLSPTFPPYHVFGFSRHSLHVLLEKHGFEIKRVKVRAGVRSYASRGLKGGLVAVAEISLRLIANQIGMAGNMYVWASPVVGSRDAGRRA